MKPTSHILLVFASLLLSTSVLAVRVSPAKTNEEARKKLTEVLAPRARLMEQEAMKEKDTEHFGKALKKTNDRAFLACTSKNPDKNPNAQNQCIVVVASLETLMQEYRADKARVLAALKSGGSVETIVEEPVWKRAEPNKAALRDKPVPAKVPVPSEAQVEAKEKKK